MGENIRAPRPLELRKLENIPAYPMPAAEDHAAMTRYYGSMYPPLACEFYTHVKMVCDEMDDPVNHPFLPRDRFEAMADRIMSRLESEYDFSDDCDSGYTYTGYALQQQPFRRRHRRRDLARALVISLLIAELLRRRRF